MMYTILLPIHPDYVKNIFNGTKRYEFRKIKEININKQIETSIYNREKEYVKNLWIGY